MQLGYVFYIFNQELQKSSQHREEWKFLLLIAISIFKVFISCVLGYNLLILTNYCSGRSLLNCAPYAPSRLCALPIISTRLTRLRALPIINTRLRAYAPYTPYALYAPLFCLVLCCYN